MLFGVILTLNAVAQAEMRGDTTFVHFDFNQNPWNLPTSEMKGWANYADENGCLRDTHTFTWDVNGEDLKIILTPTDYRLTDYDNCLVKGKNPDNNDAIETILFTRMGSTFTFVAPPSYYMKKVAFNVYRRWSSGGLYSGDTTNGMYVWGKDSVKVRHQTIAGTVIELPCWSGDSIEWSLPACGGQTYLRYIDFWLLPRNSLSKNCEIKISSSGNGSVTYGGTSFRNQTKSYSVMEGSSATISIIPDDGYQIASVKVNGKDVTAQVANNQLTINDITTNIDLTVVFEEIPPSELTYAGINYAVASYEDRTVRLAKGDYGQVLTVPATFAAEGSDWIVVGANADAFGSSVAAIIWEPEVAFDGNVSNPNLLLYVKSAALAPSTVKNVVVNNTAESITLTDAASGNDFYCPQAFTAKRISYEHHYSMKSGYQTCEGWETIVLPFDVASVVSQTGADLVPHTAWTVGSSQRPFWLYALTNSGWKAETTIKANTPYLIGMPNNEQYDAVYNQTGNITFTGVNVQVQASDKLTSSSYGKRSLVPNFQYQPASAGIYALNVDNQLSSNTEAGYLPGSHFISKLRPIHPFEAYLTIDDAAASRTHIPVFGNGEATGIGDASRLNKNEEIENSRYYNLHGQRIDEPKRKGIYIKNGKKVVKK